MRHATSLLAVLLAALALSPATPARADGAGIQPSDLGRIFERRFSTKQRGSGLGLHWSANTVAALGGNLFAESPGEGRGASLHLILPIAEDLSGASSSAAAG